MTGATVVETALVAERLRPCPTCGGEPTTIYEYSDKRVAYCRNCGRTYSPNMPRPRVVKVRKPVAMKHVSWMGTSKIAAFLADGYIPDGGRVAPLEARETILFRDSYRCQIEWYGVECGRDADTVDHVVPWFKGGDHRASNLRAACRDCNNRRGSLDWREETTGVAEVPVPETLTPRQWELVNQMDGLGIRPEVGTRTARAELIANGKTSSTWPNLTVACAYRRARGPVPIRENVDAVLDGPARGERHGQAKLNWVAVHEIRERWAAGGVLQRELAAEYGVTQPNVGAILSGRTWVEAL